MVSKTKSVPVPKVKKPVVTNLATTIVEQGPRDEHMRTDGYGGHVKPNTTAMNLTLSKYSDDLFKNAISAGEGLLKTLNLNIQDIQKKLQPVNDLLKELEPEKLINRIEQNLLGGRSLRSIMELPEQLKNDMVGTLGRLANGVNLGGYDLGQLIKTGQMSYQEATTIYNMVKNGDFHSLQGIASTLNAIGGTRLAGLVSPIVDLHAASALIGQIAKRVADLGDNKLLRKVTGLFKDHRERNRALSAGVVNAAARGDLNTVEAIVDVVGGRGVTSQHSTIISTLVSNYRVEPFYTPDQMNAYKRRLLALLEKIDPNWAWEEHGGERVTKLRPFITMSKDCIRILQADEGPDFTVEIMIAKSYPVQDLKQLQMKLYKDLVFKDRPLDPRKKR